MMYSELIKTLEYWKELSAEEDPEIVIFDNEYEDPIEIDSIIPTKGIENSRAIGLVFY